MRALAAIAAIAGLSVVQAQAADTKFACSRGDTVRTVSVVTETSSGRACEVQYEKTSMGQKPEVLWHADSDTKFCVQQAKALVGRLGDAGWSCKESPSESAENARLPQPYAAPVEVPKPSTAMAPAPAPQGTTAATKPLPMLNAPSTPPATQHYDPKNTATDGRAPIDTEFHLRPTIH